jgi:hypothetical protein
MHQPVDRYHHDLVLDALDTPSTDQANDAEAPLATIDAGPSPTTPPARAHARDGDRRRSSVDQVRVRIAHRIKRGDQRVWWEWIKVEGTRRGRRGGIASAERER